MAAAAIAGGIASKVQGGNFGHGFWAAGLGAGIGGGSGQGFVKVITAAIVGGTISKLTGGKFSNGAYSAAFAAAVAADWSNTNSQSPGKNTLPEYDPSHLDGKLKEIYQEMQITGDRQKAIEMIREYYGNESLGLADWNRVEYDPGIGTGGTVGRDGTLLIGSATFSRGPEWLASVIYHEGIHYEQGWLSRIKLSDNQKAAYEAEAHFRVMQNFRTFGLSLSEYNQNYEWQQNYCSKISGDFNYGASGC